MEQIFNYCLQDVSKIVDTHSQVSCFISRVMEDDDTGGRIESSLRRAYIDTVYDMRDLKGNDDIAEFVQQINTVDFVVTLFSVNYLPNYHGKTWIFKEANLIKMRQLRDDHHVHVPILISGNAEQSIPPDFFDSARTLYYDMTSPQEGEDILYITIFRILGEQILRPVFQNLARSEEKFKEIQSNYMTKQRRLPSVCDSTVLRSVIGFFPQSLVKYGAFIDRTDSNGVSFLHRIFEELFLIKDESLAFITLCASGMGGVGKTTLAIEYAQKYGPFYNVVYGSVAPIKLLSNT